MIFVQSFGDTRDKFHIAHLCLVCILSVLNELTLFNTVFFYFNKDFILCENDTGLYLCISKSFMVVILAFFISTKTPYGDWNILERRNANE